MKNSKTLLKVFLLFVILLLTIFLVNPFNRVSSQVKTNINSQKLNDVTLKGQLIEINNTMNSGMMGMNMMGYMGMCRNMMGMNMMGTNMGNMYYSDNKPLGIVTEDGVLYCPLFYANNSIDNIKDYIGEKVAVTGSYYGWGMMGSFMITSIEKQ